MPENNGEVLFPCHPPLERGGARGGARARRGGEEDAARRRVDLVAEADLKGAVGGETRKIH